MESFTNKTKREQYLTKLGELERSKDLGEIETMKYLGNKLSIDIMQIIKDICLTEGIDFETVKTTTALDLNEDQCIKNMTTYTERLFYIDTNIHDTLMLIYSTLVSYINYNDLVYEDLVRMFEIAEKEQGSYLQGKYVDKL